MTIHILQLTTQCRKLSEENSIELIGGEDVLEADIHIGTTPIAKLLNLINPTQPGERGIDERSDLRLRLD
jgi:hypothetical protein